MRNFKSVTIAAISIAILTFSIGYMLNLKADIEKSVLRLHIVGASDTDYDQSLKIRVRDKILTDFSALFSECHTLSDSISAASSHKDEIKSSAEAELLSCGCDAPVTVDVGKCRFPTKHYGNLTLPSGTYTALNIKIGKAQGHNWWCVMYPPLCITDKNVILNEAAREKLKSSLSADEYRLITENKAPDIKIKFKIIEILSKLF